MKETDGLFDMKSNDIVISRDDLNRKVGDLTLKELIRILIFVKKSKDPRVIHDVDVRGKILELLKTSGTYTMYDMSKILKIPYQNIRYHCDILNEENKIVGSEIIDENKRRKIFYNVVGEVEDVNENTN